MSLLILPGLMCDGAMFAPTLAAFPSAQVVNGWYGAATTLGEMAELALDSAPGRFDLLGHSMGARIALEILRRAPHRVNRLILAFRHPPAAARRARMRHALRDIGRNRVGALVDTWLPPLVAADRRPIRR
jgi:pimeloyl-ACP methyl ester carboxylesterase